MLSPVLVTRSTFSDQQFLSGFTSRPSFSSARIQINIDKEQARIEKGIESDENTGYWMIQRSVEQSKCNGKYTSNETDTHKEEQQCFPSNTSIFVCIGEVH